MIVVSLPNNTAVSYTHLDVYKRQVPHRLEEVRSVNGVRYINDSKGTNPEAVIKLSLIHI